MNTNEPSLILPLDTLKASLEDVGGKGANLAKLARAGYPIPDGFLVTTHAYQTYVAANDLQEHIEGIIQETKLDDPEALESASTAIRGLFIEGKIPSAISRKIRRAYTGMHMSPVAVRSSATAEDLPEMSFAGQQDTFLNIINEKMLLKAVMDCWSSLWTARAIAYRARNNINQKAVSLAVVVQKMVQSEVSGVMFTANPLSGLRSETVIDAAFGLGEALVSGQVEPDHYVVDTGNRIVLDKTLGAKALIIRSLDDGGVSHEQIDAAEQQALPDDQILALAKMGEMVEAEYGFPQDIEWAWADNQLFLLQSRPITTLFPLPEGLEEPPLRVMFSLASVQGLFDPMTPLGIDAIRMLFAGGAGLFGLQRTHDKQGGVRMAAGRLWVDISSPIRTEFGKKIITSAFKYIDPVGREILISLLDEPALKPQQARPKPRSMINLLRFFLPMLLRVIGNLIRPEHRRDRFTARTERMLQEMQSRSAAIRGERSEKLQARIAIYRELTYGFVDLAPLVLHGVIAGMAPFFQLHFLMKKLEKEGADFGGKREDLGLEIARGMPHNVTSEMDLALWDAACAVRDDPISADRFHKGDAQQLAAEYLAGCLPKAAQTAIETFMERYGMRGLAEFDFGRPRWRENPHNIMQNILSYLKIEESKAPDVAFANGAKRAEAAAECIAEAVRGTRAGKLKARLVLFMVSRFRSWGGLREYPKFTIIRMMGIARQGLLESGREFVAAGLLKEPDDLFFLYLKDLEAFARGEEGDWSAQIAQNRAFFEQEMGRKQIPRLLLSDGRAFFEGVQAPEGVDGENILVGSPVSPGVIEGIVRVVLDPHKTQLVPGEILVCPGTDPAWTPLFLAAGGLVMEMGGLMTHGAVVAREYGLPAVVGVYEATIRLQDGQRIRVDGSSGQVVILE
jgi:rifampicin phosphotransferase